MSSAKKRAWLGLAIVGFLVFSVWAEHYGANAEKHRSVTVFGRSALGTSVFHQWLTETKAAPTRLAQKAVLTESDVGNEAYAILSPRAPISKREAKQLEAFVRNGGKLILSSHNEATQRNLRYLATQLNVALPDEEVEGFTNAIAVTLSVTKDDALFRRGEKIAFYSAHQFGGRACATDPLACYRQIHSLDKGTVLVLAGLPFFANGLIAQADNSAAALRLAAWGKGITFDEYHHFFSDRTWLDLLKNLSFSVPMFGMLLLMILYFVFGHAEFHQKRPPAEKLPANSMHDWNEGIVTASVTRDSLPAALAFHRRCLEALFRRGIAEPLPPQNGGGDRKELLRVALEMVRSHQNFLLRKRKVLK